MFSTPHKHMITEADPRKVSLQATVRVAPIKPLAVFLFLSVALVFAAGPSGTFLGTVTDPSGKVIPQAKVVIRNQETGWTREVSTSPVGDYSVPLVPPGLYAVAVEAANFRRAARSDVKLDVNETVPPL